MKTLASPFSGRLTALLLAVAAAAPVAAVSVRVTIENLSPAGGTFLTPFWVGFHNGTFDLYNSGSPISPALERLAEDGTTGVVSSAFTGSGAGSMDATILSGGPIPPFAPGAVSSMTFNLDPSSALNRYFSYASMVIPSNDAFIANGNPMAFPIFSNLGEFLGADFLVLGSQVLDAGSELNDEVPSNTAFLGQMSPNTGVDENGVVHPHLGFLPPGSGGILDIAQFINADFTAADFQIARITLTQVPEASAVGASSGLVALSLLAWRRRQAGARKS